MRYLHFLIKLWVLLIRELTLGLGSILGFDPLIDIKQTASELAKCCFFIKIGPMTANLEKDKIRYDCTRAKLPFCLSRAFLKQEDKRGGGTH